MAATNVIEVTGLRKTYGKLVAVDDVSAQRVSTALAASSGDARSSITASMAG